ncbi:hypothetical protein OSTOST_09528, partial [Ostertagia ostertagi]
MLGTMRAVEYCATAFAIMVHFWQISPALFCTFTQIPPPKVIFGTIYRNRSVGIEWCLSSCYEKPYCDHIAFNKI